MNVLVFVIRYQVGQVDRVNRGLEREPMDVTRILSELRAEREDIEEAILYLERFNSVGPITTEAKSPIPTFRRRPSAREPFSTGCRMVRRARMAEGPSLVSPSGK